MGGLFPSVDCDVMPIADSKFKRLTAKNVDRSPLKRGVYALYVNKTTVFLGSARGGGDTIRSRLRGHLASKTQEATRYKREPSATPAARLKTLLTEHVATHGRLPVQNAAQS